MNISDTSENQRNDKNVNMIFLLNRKENKI